VPVLRLHGDEPLHLAGWRYVRLARQRAHGLQCARLCAAVHRRESPSAGAAEEDDGRGSRGDCATWATWKEDGVKARILNLARSNAWLLALIGICACVWLLAMRVERCY
jgi:hypothetical protein